MTSLQVDSVSTSWRPDSIRRGASSLTLTATLSRPLTAVEAVRVVEVLKQKHKVPPESVVTEADVPYVLIKGVYREQLRHWVATINSLLPDVETEAQRIEEANRRFEGDVTDEVAEINRRLSTGEEIQDSAAPSE